ncbi:MAG: hypothetical protein R3B82_03690 [Sandaracinaceae bacterium]
MRSRGIAMVAPPLDCDSMFASHSVRAAGSLPIPASTRAASSAAGSAPSEICPSGKPSTCW